MARTRKTALAASLAAVALALSVTACSAEPAKNTAGEASGTPVSGGTLRVANSSDYNCLDGQQARGSELNVAAQILDTLTQQDPETGELVGLLADANDQADAALGVVRDAVGNVLHDGDTVTLVKSVKVSGGGGGVIKVGTKVTGIRLITNGVGDHDIDAKVPGFGKMQLKSSVVKRAG